ncbi:hypothetical protein BH10PSE1_BH10PSE1_18350 [soil metagenome]
MALFLTTLVDDGHAFTVKRLEEGFLVSRVDGYESAFNVVARRVIDKAGPTYAAFPRSDDQGGYDSVHVIPFDA